MNKIKGKQTTESNHQRLQTLDISDAEYKTMFKVYKETKDLKI